MEYTKLASSEVLTTTMAAMKERNFSAEVLETRADALQRIKDLIPKGASVMNGSSTTLQEIGYIDYLKEGNHGWNNLHEKVLAEKDPMRQATLRRETTVSDYYLGSVHAIAETGELIFGSNTGSQMPHLVYTSPNVILVVGTHKIVPTVSDAMERLEQYVVPLEDARMQKAYGMGTNLSKILIWRKEVAFNQRNILVLFVNEKLGF